MPGEAIRRAYWQYRAMRALLDELRVDGNLHEVVRLFELASFDFNGNGTVSDAVTGRTTATSYLLFWRHERAPPGMRYLEAEVRDAPCPTAASPTLMTFWTKEGRVAALRFATALDAAAWARMLRDRGLDPRALMRPAPPGERVPF